MELTSLSPMKNLEFLGQNNQSQVLSDNSQSNSQIKQGMSPNEIADVISDHLINVVKQEFETAKKKYRENS